MMILTYNDRFKCFLAKKAKLVVYEGWMWNNHLSVLSVVQAGSITEDEVIFPGKLYKFDNYEAYLRVRLLSTRGGRQKKFYVGRSLLGCLNKAPYNPVFRGFVSTFIWIPTPYYSRMYRSDHFREVICEDDVVAQLSDTGVIDYIFKAVASPTCPSHDYEVVHVGPNGCCYNYEYMRAAFKALLDNPCSFVVKVMEQGDMKLTEVTGPPEYSHMPYVSFTCPNPTIGSHFLSGADLVVRYDEAYLVNVQREAYVLSKGHMPLYLDKGWYIVKIN